MSIVALRSFRRARRPDLYIHSFNSGHNPRRTSSFSWNSTASNKSTNLPRPSILRKALQVLSEAMPSKQATLGYVRTGQTTLGLVFLIRDLLFIASIAQTDEYILSRKFFGQPNGTKDPPLQSKLAFSTKSKLNGEPSKDEENAKQEDDGMEMDQAENKSESTRVKDESNGNNDGMFRGRFSFCRRY